jgi:hypothetical protein
MRKLSLDVACSDREPWTESLDDTKDWWTCPGIQTTQRPLTFQSGQDIRAGFFFPGAQNFREDCNNSCSRQRINSMRMKSAVGKDG